MYRAFPEAKALFLYRNAETWARSASHSIRSVIDAAGPEATATADPMMRLLTMMDITEREGTASAASKGKAPDIREGIR